MSLGWGPRPPDVTTFIFSVWIQRNALFADGDNKCLWPYCIEKCDQLSGNVYKQLFLPLTLWLTSIISPGFSSLWSTGHSKGLSEHSLLLICQRFWLHLYLSFYENK